MAFDKLRDVADKYSSGLQKGSRGIEQLGTVMKGVSQLKGAISGNNSGDDGQDEGEGKVKSAVKGAKNVAKGAKQGGGQTVKTSHLIEEQIDVASSVTTVYNQWTQFKEFAQIMKGIESVDQRSPDKVTWTAKIGPSKRQWKTQITQQIPDKRIAWKSTGGANTTGVVTFHRLDDDLTRVMIQMEYHPSGVIESTGNFLRIPRRRVRRDLKLFKNRVELAGKASGAWRGTIGRGGGSRSSGNRRTPTSSGKRSSRSSRSRTGSSRSSSRSSGQRRRSA